MIEFTDHIMEIQNGHHSGLFTEWLLFGNSVFTVIVATATILYLPYRTWKQRSLLWLLIFVFGLFVPVIGSLGFSYAMLFGMRWGAHSRRDTFNELTLPEFDPIGRKESNTLLPGGLRSRIVQNKLPAEQRMRFIVALQHLPVTAVSPILRTLLDDNVEDVRLIAFGMLDREEKKIAARIHKLLQETDHPSTSHRFQHEKQLAELYWELIYSGLVQGDMRSYTLDKALIHAKAALETNDKDAGVHFLAGRILNALGLEVEAEEQMLAAMALGIPEYRIQPYFAEFAFKHGDYHSIRELLGSLPGYQLTPHLQPVVDYWSSQEASS